MKVKRSALQEKSENSIFMKLCLIMLPLFYCCLVAEKKTVPVKARPPKRQRMEAYLSLLVLVIWQSHFYQEISLA